MIIKSYEVKKNSKIFSNYNSFLLYGENPGLKKDIKNYIEEEFKKNDEDLEILKLYENEITDNEQIFYDFISSGSLFSKKKIIIIFEATDKIIKKIDHFHETIPENIYLILLSGILEKKSKVRSFFEKNKKSICIPCYLDTTRDLEIIVQSEIKKNNLSISREALNLLIEKSNSDRGNLRNELEKIKSYSFKKKILDISEIKNLINFSGNYKSEVLVNECLCGNTIQYKKIISELYSNAVNQILLLRILANKVQRLLKIKEQGEKSNNLDDLINTSKPAIFWKEKPLVKKQLSIWSLNELNKIIVGINKIELFCKKNPQVSNAVFFNFFLEICTKANNYS